MFPQSFSENSQQNLRRFSTSRFDVRWKATVVHEVAEAATVKKSKQYAIKNANFKTVILSIKIFFYVVTCPICHSLLFFKCISAILWSIFYI